MGNGRSSVTRGPCQGTPKPAKENSRDRVLREEEIFKIYNACHDFSYPFGPLFQILLLTAQRHGEVSGRKFV